jgi:hypothetical protein
MMAGELNFNADAVWRSGFLYVSLLTVVLIYCARALHSVTPPEIQEPAPLTSLADLSYDIYLFHWPLYIIFSDLISNNIIASVVTLIVSVLLSAVVFYRVENIFNNKFKLANIIVLGIILISAAASGAVIYNAPVITSIEADFNSNQVMQDVSEILDLKNRSAAVNDEPLIYAANGVLLQANLLPAPAPSVSTPPPAATPTPSPAAPAPSPVPAPNPVEITGGVTVIGDSVALGAQSTLMNTISDCYVDAKVSRSIGAGYDIMIDLQNSGKLREYVVIALGTNGHNNYAKLLTQFIDNLEPGHRLIFVTTFDGRSNENAIVVNKTADWERGLPDEYSYVTVADWAGLISSQTNLLAGDKVHMGGQSSMNLYADCVAGAISAASQKPAK